MKESTVRRRGDREGSLQITREEIDGDEWCVVDKINRDWVGKGNLSWRRGITTKEPHCKVYF